MTTTETNDKATEAYRQIKALIQRGAFGAGERLTEAKAAKLTGMGRGPVRESLLRLEAEGLLEHQGSGRSRVVACVEDEDPEELLHRYELREQIEGGAARLAAKNMTGWQIDQLRELAQAVEDAHQEDDRAKRFGANARFHDYLLAHCGNPLMLKVWQTLHLTPSRPRTPQSEAKIMAAVPKTDGKTESLIDLVDAIARHDPDRAEALIKQRVRQITEALRRVVWRQDRD
ncbi:MAG: GntR family transcriptional regulator [Phycisphaerae bacterium]|nr:GntR family transcriptional regulator [Phycisphaerae bacterium]